MLVKSSVQQDFNMLTKLEYIYTVADYRQFTVWLQLKTFVNVYTTYNPCNKGNLLLRLQEKV